MSNHRPNPPSPLPTRKCTSSGPYVISHDRPHSSIGCNDHRLRQLLLTPTMRPGSGVYTTSPTVQPQEDPRSHTLSLAEPHGDAKTLPTHRGNGVTATTVGKAHRRLAEALLIESDGIAKSPTKSAARPSLAQPPSSLLPSSPYTLTSARCTNTTAGGNATCLPPSPQQLTSTSPPNDTTGGVFENDVEGLTCSGLLTLKARGCDPNSLTSGRCATKRQFSLSNTLGPISGMDSGEQFHNCKPSADFGTESTNQSEDVREVRTVAGLSFDVRR